MAAFAQHIQFSSLLGVGYGGALIWAGVEWPHAVLAGALCSISGMLPDLDSDSGKPSREMFEITAAVVPLLLLHRLRATGLAPEETLLLAGAIYLAIRFGASWLFKHLTVHRGMFHSLPAAAIAAEVAYLLQHSAEPNGRYTLAGGVFLGFLSHLVLDELWSVNAQGLKIRFNKSAGSALKLFSSSMPATVMTWLILGGLTYLVGIDRGYFQPIHLSVDYPPAFKAVKH
jgi:membrane-bound metal-dependent hydrolase YbcI (DUF457 family)